MASCMKSAFKPNVKINKYHHTEITMSAGTAGRYHCRLTLTFIYA